MEQQLTKQMYKDIKRYNREQMELLLKNISRQSYNYGCEVATAKVVEQIEKGINNTKGIGPKRGAELLKNITQALLETEKPKDNLTLIL